MQSAQVALKDYLQKQFSALIVNPYFEEWVDAHADFNSRAAQEIALPKLTDFLKS